VIRSGPNRRPSAFQHRTSSHELRHGRKATLKEIAHIGGSARGYKSSPHR
jgi:hypothetical protein